MITSDLKTVAELQDVNTDIDLRKLLDYLDSSAFHIKLRAYCFRYRMPDAVEDIRQEVALRVINLCDRHPEKIARIMNSNAYLLKIAHNLIINKWREERVKVAWTISLDELSAIEHPSIDPTQAYEAAIFLHRTMPLLKPKERQYLELLMEEEASREIARVLGVTRHALRKRYERLREKLKDPFTSLAA